MTATFHEPISGQRVLVHTVTDDKRLDDLVVGGSAWPDVVLLQGKAYALTEWTNQTAEYDLTSSFTL